MVTICFFFLILVNHAVTAVTAQKLIFVLTAIKTADLTYPLH
jgi:hypothetical protein